MGDVGTAIRVFPTDPLSSVRSGLFGKPKRQAPHGLAVIYQILQNNVFKLFEQIQAAERVCVDSIR